MEKNDSIKKDLWQELKALLEQKANLGAMQTATLRDCTRLDEKINQVYNLLAQFEEKQ